MVYPAAVLVFLGLGVAALISWAATLWCGCLASLADCASYLRSSSHPNDTTTGGSWLCPLLRAQRVLMVRATVADSMASRYTSFQSGLMRALQYSRTQRQAVRLVCEG